MKNKNFGTYLLIFIISIVGVIVSICSKLNFANVMKNYQYNVIVILISMELFTNVISKTGIIEKISLAIALKSRGNKRNCLILFSILIFFISAFLNNITAVLIILPIVFVLLKTIGVTKKYINIFFALFLSISNTGGASSPIGDFPAIVIMNSGITSFKDYLFRALPFFIVISFSLIMFWTLRCRSGDKNNEYREFSISLLKSKYKNIKFNRKLLYSIMIIFVGMFLSWSIIPQTVLTPEIIALIGCILAIVLSIYNNIELSTLIDFQSIFMIGSFMFLANIISETGVLVEMANYLQSSIKNPKILLLVIMILSSIISGFFGAGAAASAMMPVIVFLCNTTLSQNADWVSIAYASSICAGSSMFLWSATAGFVLSENINEANIIDEETKKEITWNIKDYLIYGIQNYFIQIGISLLMIFIII